MSHIDLPRPIEDYFAYAELAAGRSGRRFTITCPYVAAGKLDRLQWWWSLGAVRERILGDAGVAELRRQETERFRQHIERWLANNHRQLVGDTPIPEMRELPAPATVAAVDATDASEDADALRWRTGQVANG